MCPLVTHRAILMCRSLHFLLYHLHAKLKQAVSAGGGGGGGGGGGAFGRGPPPRPPPPADGCAPIPQDIPSLELSLLELPQLLERLTPVLRRFRPHLERLAQTVDALGDDPSADAEGGESIEAEHQECVVAMLLSDGVQTTLDAPASYARYAAPSLVLMLQCLQLLLSAPALRADAQCEERLRQLLAHFGEGAAAADAPPPADPCASAFDFFLTLRDRLSAAQCAELIKLQCAIVDLQERGGGGAVVADELDQRRTHLAELAAYCLERGNAAPGAESAPSAPLGAAQIRALFECQVRYTETPMALLEEWVETHLAELIEQGGGACEAQPLLTQATLPNFLKVLFTLLRDEAKKLRLPRAAAAADGSSPDDEALERTRETIRQLQQLAGCFRGMVQVPNPQPTSNQPPTNPQPTLNQQPPIKP